MQDSKDILIFKELKKRLNYLKELGYNVVLLSLFGSQNYNLDINNEEYKSDIDCLAIILPDIEDILNIKEPISKTIILDNNEHIEIKDIRIVNQLWQKQNIQFLEILFTRYKIINKEYSLLIQDLLKMREQIVNINKYKLIQNIYGIATQKYNNLSKITSSRKLIISKFGYDGKQLHHLLRLYIFLYNLLIENKSFEECLSTFTSEQYNLLIKAKLNKFTLSQANELNTTYYNKILILRSVFQETNNIEDKEDHIIICNRMNLIKDTILKNHFKRNLITTTQNEVYPDQYKNVFVTSDLHFGHENILKFEPRREKLNITTIEEHDQALIKNWNNVVTKNDLVIIIGDFSFHKPQKTMEILKQLKGDKILIVGNHDCAFLNNRLFDKSLFKEIKDYKEFRYQKYNICVMHYPIQSFKHMASKENFSIHLHGHIHSEPIIVPMHSYNVGVDTNNYIPINILDAIEKAKLNQGGLINGRF